MRPAISRLAQIEKTVSSVGSATRKVRKDCRNLKPDPCSGSHEEMMHADRQREHEEHDEGEPPHRIAVEPPARRLRHQRIEGDIGRHQPEIDDRVQRHRKQRARERGVDQIAPAEGARQQDADEFEEHAASPPMPTESRSR